MGARHGYNSKSASKTQAEYNTPSLSQDSALNT